MSPEQDDRLYTCGHCHHLRYQAIQNLRIYYCGHTGFVVPHRSESARDLATFHRVPEACPLPGSQVVKTPSGSTSGVETVIDWSDPDDSSPELHIKSSPDAL